MFDVQYFWYFTITVVPYAILKEVELFSNEIKKE